MSEARPGGAAAPLLRTWRRLQRWPAGGWLFSRAVCFKAPYFGSIAPRVLRLEPCLCEARLHDRRAVRNHIGSVLAIALCNLAEPVERKFLKALKNSDIEALTFPEQLAEGVREGWITADERTQLEQLRELTWDAITVDDFESHEMESASLHRLQQVYRASAA